MHQTSKVFNLPFSPTYPLGASPSAVRSGICDPNMTAQLHGQLAQQLPDLRSAECPSDIEHGASSIRPQTSRIPARCVPTSCPCWHKRSETCERDMIRAITTCRAPSYRDLIFSRPLPPTRAIEIAEIALGEVPCISEREVCCLRVFLSPCGTTSSSDSMDSRPLFPHIFS